MIKYAFLSAIFLAETIKAADGEGGMPQLNPESFASQIFWLAILFTILFALIHYIFLPKIEKIRKERDETINNYLSDAKSINDSINSIIDDMKRDFDNAKNQQSSELREAFEENKKILDKKFLEINEEFEQKKIQLNKDIESNRISIISDLPSICVNLSDALYEKIMKDKKKGNVNEFKKLIGE